VALPAFVFQPGPAPAKPEQYYYSYINQMMGVGRMLYFTGWAQSGSYLGRIDLSQPSKPVLLDYTAVKGSLVGAESDGSAVYTTTYYWDEGQAGTFNKYSLNAQGASVSWSVSFNMSVTSAIIKDGKAYLTLYKYPMWYYIDYYPGARERSVQPSTTLCVLDLKGSSPVVTGALQLDGYASAAMLYGSKLIVTGNSMLAAYDISTGAPRYAGAAAIRGSFESMRAFDGGVLVSEGYYGTETVTF
jgi:hypothetical protein